MLKLTIWLLVQLVHRCLSCRCFFEKRAAAIPKFFGNANLMACRWQLFYSAGFNIYVPAVCAPDGNCLGQIFSWSKACFQNAFNDIGAFKENWFMELQYLFAA